MCRPNTAGDLPHLILLAFFPMRLYVATTNPGKLRDFAHAAEEHMPADGTGSDANGRIDIVPLPDLAEIPAPPEDELTFAGNAQAKALYYSQLAPGLMVLADDSGLEVTCLDNAPGVRSARYADDLKFPAAPAATVDERNNAALLREMDGVPENCRQARYHCVLALALNGEVLATADGTVEGTILNAPRGEGGFGYDPLFFLPELEQTMAELDPAARLSVSHRGRALRQLLELWPPK
jgi:XTP/dITP diphosphohydrolase